MNAAKKKTGAQTAPLSSFVVRTRLLRQFAQRLHEPSKRRDVSPNGDAGNRAAPAV